MRGLAFETMGPVKRLRVYAKIAVPLILGALVKSQMLDIVLQSKAFTGSPERTYLHEDAAGRGGLRRDRRFRSVLHRRRHCLHSLGHWARWELGIGNCGRVGNSRQRASCQLVLQNRLFLRETRYDALSLRLTVEGDLAGCTRRDAPGGCATLGARVDGNETRV